MLDLTASHMDQPSRISEMISANAPAATNHRRMPVGDCGSPTPHIEGVRGHETHGAALMTPSQPLESLIGFSGVPILPLRSAPMHVVPGARCE